MREYPSSASDDSSPELPVDLNGFERQLAQFRPACSTLDRERVLFEAGRAAAFAELDRSQSDANHMRMRRVLRLWQSAALLMFAVSVGLGASLAVRAPEVNVVEWHLPPPRLDAPSSKVTTNVVPRQLVQQHASQRAEGQSTANPTTHFRGNFPSLSPVPAPKMTGPLRARGQALDESLNLADGALRTLPRSQDPQNTVRTEPPLTPRSLMGEQGGLTIERLMKEST